MAFELPSIGFKEAGGIVESIDPGVTGYLCDPGNTEQMGEYILKLVEDPGLRRKMGVAGRKRVTSNFLAVDRARDIENNILEVVGIPQ